MDADQSAICEFLRQWPDQYVSRKEICRRAGGKWRFREDENWAVPVLSRMREERIIESDDTGHFRLVSEKSKDGKNTQRMWMSPAIRSILKSSGQSFGTIDLDKDPETKAQMAGSESLLSYQAEAPFAESNASAQRG
jgi:hypothetical protein